MVEGETLSWPETGAGEESRLPCPDTLGFAFRSCGQDREWRQPDTDDCVDVAGGIRSLTEKVPDLNLYVAIPAFSQTSFTM